MTPWFFFYENYTFYPHLTLLFSSFVLLGVTVWFVLEKILGIWLTAASLVLLSLTWTLFHPFFVAILMSFFLVNAPGTRRRVDIVTITTIVVFLSISPSIKNKVYFDLFSNGSWLGLNLSQVSPVSIEGCSFNEFLQNERLPHEPLATALNKTSIIPLSKLCARKSYEQILSHPYIYFRGRAQALLQSLSKWPSNYFFMPVNWARFPSYPDVMPLRNESGGLNYAAIFIRLFPLGFYSAGLFLLGLVTLIHPNPAKRKIHMFCFLYVGVFLLLAHAFNGGEQQRMRYTIEPIFFMSYISMFVIAKNFIRKNNGIIKERV